MHDRSKDAAGSRRRRRVFTPPIAMAAVASMVISMMAALAFAPVASAAPARLAAPVAIPGWTQDFLDDFNGPLNAAKWGRYESSSNQSKMLSEYDAGNVATSNGAMTLRTYNAGGSDWRAAGVSGAKGFSAAKGKWAVRAKFDRAYGIGFAFLLYPKGGGWPPEVDFGEGTMGGPRVMVNLHWSSANLTDPRSRYDVDMTQWHTYGVVISTNKLEFTLDGVVWSTMNNSGSPTMPLWIGFQTGAKGCPGSTGECVGSQTPSSAKISIDWVAHWKRA